MSQTKTRGNLRDPTPEYLAGQRDGYALGWEHGYWIGCCEAAVQRAYAQPPRRPLKVMYITSGKGFPYSPLDEGIAATLKMLVNHVIVVAPDQNTVAVAARERPDLALVLDGMDYPPEQADRLRAMGIATAIWFTDDPYYTDVTAELASHYSHVFTLERSCVPFYERRGCRNVHHLPLGVFHEAFRPRNPRLHLRSDVCFIGTAFWNRAEFFQNLLPLIDHRNFRLSGLWWERMANFETYRDRIDLGKWMGSVETAEHYSACKLVINIHRASNDDTFNRNTAGIQAVSPNPRTFEISACGTLQLTDFREDLPQFYVPGEEVVVYDSPEDLAAKVEYYLEHEEERRRIALKGLYRTMRDHTYTSRLSRLLSLALPR